MKTPHLPRILLIACTALTAFAGSPILAQTIPKGDLIVDLENFAKLPPTKKQGYPAQVNVLRPSPDGRIFVNDQYGFMYFVSADGATVTLYLDLTKHIPLYGGAGEVGFQSFAFHPDFNHPGTAGYGKFYTMASQSDTTSPATFTPEIAGVPRDHDEVLLEWTAADPAASVFAPVDPSHPFREVLRIARPNSNHNAGYISFNPTADAADPGNLYIGTGDSGGGGDSYLLAQTTYKAYGAILRIDPLLPGATDPNRSANGQYSIPADNPYTTKTEWLKEKYMMGFRNPQRFTWDSANGHMFVADIGQIHVEEIDLGQAGANYGWNAREGSYVYNRDAAQSIGPNVRDDAAQTGYTYPIAEYMHYAKNNAVTTGPAYREGNIPALAGRLLFGDFVNGMPYTLDADHLPAGGQSGITELRLRSNGTEMSFLQIVQQTEPSADRADLRYGTDADGNVYFLDKQDGIIRRVVAAAEVSVRLKKPTISRAAGQSGKYVFTRQGGDVSKPIKIDYKLHGSLRNGTDYAALSGQQKIKPGETTSSLRIVPLAGRADGKVKLKIVTVDGYPVEGTANIVLKVTECTRRWRFIV